MAGSTTRLGLYKPGGGLSGTILPDEVADIDKINDDLDAIDEAVGFFVCTSVTRPASPWNGQPIAETDTGDLRYWKSATSSWELAAPLSITASATTLAAITVARDGQTATVSANDSRWQWDGTKWVLASIPRVASVATRDALYVAPIVPQQGDTVFRTDKGYHQTYYTVSSGVATAGWYAEPGIIFNVAPGTINPVPNAVTDYNATTITLGANELMVVEVAFMVTAQHNIAMSSYWRVLLGAAVQATIDFNFTTGDQRVPGYRTVRIILPAATASTIKNQAFASAASNAVYYEAGLTIRTISPVTLA